MTGIEENRLKVLLVCSGLGTTNRGFESFFRQCFDALKGEPSLELKLFKGMGESAPGEEALWNLPRGSMTAKIFGLPIGNRPYVIEQLTFSLSLLTRLRRENPDIIFFSDKQVGNILWHFRASSGLHYRLLLSNGTPQRPPFSHADHVQQLTPDHLETALKAGISEEFQTLLPYGIDLEPAWQPIAAEQKETLRRVLGLPLSRPIVISVGWINEGHKRMGYLVKEIAQLEKERPYLVMLGHQDGQSEPVLQLARERLAESDYRIATVSPEVVVKFLRAADLFVLASRGEGFGRVYLEALKEGLPCIAHDFSGSRYILGEWGIFGDLNVDGCLADLIRKTLAHGDTDELKQQRHEDVRRRFGWESLRGGYVDMLYRAAKKGVPNSNVAKRSKQ